MEVGERPQVVWSFDWSDVVGADRYHLAVHRHEGGRKPEIEGILETSQYDHVHILPIPLRMTDSWNWQVRSRVNGQWTAWSEARPFTVASTTLTAQDIPNTVISRDLTPPTPVASPTPIGDLPRKDLAEPEEVFGYGDFAFSPDGRWVTAGIGTTEGGSHVVVWNAETGELIHTLEAFGPQEPVKSPSGNLVRRTAHVQWLAFSRDGQRLAGANPGLGLARIWNISEQSLLCEISLSGPLHSYNNLFPCLAFSSDGGTLVCLSRETIPVGSGEIKIGGRLTAYGTATGQPRWSEENTRLNTISLTPDGSGVVGIETEIVNIRLNERDRPTWRSVHPTLRVRDLATGVLGDVGAALTFHPHALIPLPDRNALAGITNNGMAVIEWPGGQIRSPLAWDKDRSACRKVVVSQDGQRILRTWTTYTEIVNLENHTAEWTVISEFPDTIFACAFSADLRRMACNHNGSAILELPHQAE